MKSHPRFTIDRAAFILVPNQPFLDWINAVDPDRNCFTLEATREELNIYLVSPDQVETSRDVTAWIDKRWSLLFEHALREWFMEEAMWPTNRTLKMFHEWFDVQVHSMVWDMEDADIQHEDRVLI